MSPFEQFLLSLFTKASLMLKPYSIGIVGAFLNGLIKSHVVAKRGLKKATLSMKLASAVASLLIGLGCVFVVEGVYSFTHTPKDPSVLKAIFFVGATAGVETIMWLIGHAESLADTLERRLSDKIIQGRVNNEKGKDSAHGKSQKADEKG